MTRETADLAKGRVEASQAAMTQRVGWIGAGKMGAPMIRNLLKQGVEVRVAEPVAARRAELAAAGATEAATLADLAGCSLVFSALPNDAVLTEVVLGKGGLGQGGLAETLSPPAIFVDMSTVSPTCSARVAEALARAGIGYLRAPVSGSTALAETAAISILASGDQGAWEVALPYFEVLSAQRFYLGAGEEARFMKLVLNTLVGATAAFLGEAMALGESGGLDAATMMEVICESAAASPLLKYKKAAVSAGDYTPAFSVAQMIKDYELILGAARDKSVPAPTTSLTLELYRAAANSGRSEEDFFSLVAWTRSLAPR